MRGISSGRRGFNLILTFVLMYGLLHTTPAGAKPSHADTIIGFSMRTSDIPSPMCVNSHHFLGVNVSVDRSTTLNGSTVDLRGGLGPPSVSILATVDNPAVVSVFSEEIEVNALQGSIGFSGVGETRLTAREAGQATLTLTASVTYAGQTLVLPSVQIPIRVVQCKYVVTMRLQWSNSFEGISIFSMGFLEMELEPGENENSFEGNAPFSFLSGASTPVCAISLSGTNISTHIQGVLLDDQLKLSYDFGTGQETTNVQCPDAGGSGTHAFDPRLSGLDPRTFPSTGGTQSMLITGVSPPARLTITVRQVVE